ncbi:uncharacterized protein [Aegilops tauschii subsp. strangulata]|uniref:uncharacterized protein isoform X1 n=1 Tax=Aegilops tauschii subsp. strangulata TaxID=200361 RepID=UPI001ABC27BC
MLLVALFSCVGDDVRVALPFLCCSAGEENPRPTRGFVRQPPEEEASHGRTSLSLNAAPSHPSSCSCRFFVFVTPLLYGRRLHGFWWRCRRSSRGSWTGRCHGYRCTERRSCCSSSTSGTPQHTGKQSIRHPEPERVRGTCTMASSIRRWRGMRPTSTGACLS